MRVPKKMTESLKKDAIVPTEKLVEENNEKDVDIEDISIEDSVDWTSYKESFWSWC
jgi:hypothetical protein